MNMWLVVLLLSACAAMQTAGGRAGDLRATPAFIVLGMENGTIIKCQYDDPETCDIIVNGDKLPTEGHPVLSVVVHSEFIFAALWPGNLLRCEWNRKNSCTVRFRSKDQILCLAVSDGYLYIGTGFLDEFDELGEVLRCGILQPDSCSVVFTFNGAVRGIYEFNKYMYVATNFSLFYCSVVTEWRCLKVKSVPELYSSTRSVSHMANIIILAAYVGVTYNNMSSSGTVQYIKAISVPGDVAQEVTTFKRITYVLDMMGNIFSSDGNSLTPFVRHEGTSSLTFMYSSHAMASELVYGVSVCSPPRASAVFSPLVAASVVDGLLWDARGAVDTRRAERGYSGRAAVFAMGLDGQLLLSDAHRSGLLHMSSLLARVAGAGEIHVENGVIKKIVACSTLYRPSVALNRQVVDELFKRGYTRADEIILKECNYTCDRM